MIRFVQDGEEIEEGVVMVATDEQNETISGIIGIICYCIILQLLYSVLDFGALIFSIPGFNSWQSENFIYILDLYHKVFNTILGV